MELDTRTTVIIAILVLFLGKYLNNKSSFLQNFNIPEPVTGGLLVSIAFALLYQLNGIELNFSLDARDELLVVFFTTIGLSARFSTLIQGGRTLITLLIIAVGYLFIQNLTGLTVAGLTGLDRSIGLIGGSVSLSGGHGTAIAWAPIFHDQQGISNAMEIGIACATFGLVFGGLIGGPLAHFLIKRYNLHGTASEPITVGTPYEAERSWLEHINVDSVLASILVVSIGVGMGISIHELLVSLDFQLPLFVCCLFAGILLTNTAPLITKAENWPAGTASLALVSDLSLSLFLAMSLMSLQLWTLIDLAGPIMLILGTQVLVVCLLALFVVFPLLGRNYDAAVMTSGYAGLALGATPTAIVNMSAVTKKFGAAPKAFIVVPLVGAFFIDIANAMIIRFFI